MKVILNCVPLVVEAVNGLPLKKVAWISLGAMCSAAKAADAARSMPAGMSRPTRMGEPSTKRAEVEESVEAA